MSSAAVWFSLKKSLNCRSEVGEVHDPNIVSAGSGRNLSKISTSTRKTTTTIRSGCSRSIANLKDVVIHGSKRHTEKQQLQSPRSIGSSELLNPIVHEVVLSNSTCELKITGYPFQDSNGCGGNSGGGGGSGSPFVGTLKPGTTGPGGHHVGRRLGGLDSPIRIGSSSGLSRRTGSGFGGIVVRLRPRPRPRPKPNCGGDYNGYQGLTCHKCGERFSKWDAVESHHLSQHAVTQLVEGDSSRNIVEMICRTSWSTKPDNTNTNCNNNGIERILKVHNMQKTLAEFEEYRERVKIKASKLAKKHARCLADGNELLRFHGTTVECNLGKNDSSSLCTSEKCKVCQILRRGFEINKEINGGVGVFTASTSSRALEAIIESNRAARKALIVCRVIAGRVHRPLENVEELVGQSGFDSLAGKVGLYSNVEELFLLDPRALLPCFVVICKA